MATQFNADNLGSLKAGRRPTPMDVLVPTIRTNAEALGIVDRRSIARPRNGGPPVSQFPGA
jgi:hypothetical protein